MVMFFYSNLILMVFLINGVNGVNGDNGDNDVFLYDNLCFFSFYSIASNPGPLLSAVRCYVRIHVEVIPAKM